VCIEDTNRKQGYIFYDLYAYNYSL